MYYRVVFPDYIPIAVARISIEYISKSFVNPKKSICTVIRYLFGVIYENTRSMRRKLKSVHGVPSERTRSVFLRYRHVLGQSPRVAYMVGRYAVAQRQLHVSDLRRTSSHGSRQMGYDPCFPAVHVPVARREHKPLP